MKLSHAISLRLYEMKMPQKQMFVKGQKKISRKLCEVIK